MSNTITAIKWRAQNPNTIHDMVMGLSPAPKINPTINQVEIDEAENKLGFKLPQLLKDIYTQIGNGGFGPGYGLYQLQTMVHIYLEYINNNRMNWKKSLLPILTWGCRYESSIDCLSTEGQVYFTEIIEDNENNNSPIQIATKTQTQSFEKFMNDWANGVNLWDEIMGEDNKNDNPWSS
jgi:hypothetical protein